MSAARTTAPIPRLALSAAEVAASIGISERLYRSWREAEHIHVPEPDIEIGSVKRWAPETISRWIVEQQKREQQRPRVAASA